MKILVYLPKLGDRLHKTAFEAITAGRTVAEYLNGTVAGVAIDTPEAELQETAQYGLTDLLLIQHDLLSGTYSPSAYAKAIAEVAQSEQADILIFPNITYGKELGPRTAIILDAGYIADVIRIESSDGDLLFYKPVYAGKAIITARLNPAKKVFTIRPNMFTAKTVSSSSSLTIRAFTPALSEEDVKERRTHISRATGKIDVAEADIVVSGGRGLKAPENFKLIEELAAVLGAAVGASRAVVDAGWRPHSEQVGQTGKTISPNLYIAVGISGAVQHLAGMSSSKVIVAINKDKDAPIFQVADYGIVGDALDVLPRLTQKLKEILQKD